MTLIVLLAVLAVLAVVAVVAAGRGDNLGGTLSDPQRDRAPGGVLPPDVVRPEDVGGIRFTMALRGYRMDEVDTVLDRLSGELAARDQRIAELEDAADSGARAVQVDPEVG